MENVSETIELEGRSVLSKPTDSDKFSSVLLSWVKLLFRSKTGTVGFVIVVMFFLLAVFAEQIAPFGANQQDYSVLLLPPAWVEGGASEYLLGTDNLGRCVWSRIVYGAQISLMVGVLSVVVSGTLGMAMGLVAGYFGGWIDNVLMRIVDAFLSIPAILFILVILVVLTPGIMTVIIAIGFTKWVIYARLIRGEVLSVKEREYVLAARTIGTGDLTIILKHILPNVFSTFIVVSTLSVATTIILEASLSFLGMGVSSPNVSWGFMLADGRTYLATNWWLATFPGLAITVCVLGIIFLGDWLRDVLDPRSQGRY